MEIIAAQKENKCLWEILVPTMILVDDNDDRVRSSLVQSISGEKLWPVSTKYHKVWDAKVLELSDSDGLTRPPASHGQWENPNGKLFKEKMLPVRFMAHEKDIRPIIEFTKKYYNQEKVMCYMISDKVFVL